MSGLSGLIGFGGSITDFRFRFRLSLFESEVTLRVLFCGDYRVVAFAFELRSEFHGFEIFVFGSFDVLFGLIQTNFSVGVVGGSEFFQNGFRVLNADFNLRRSEFFKIVLDFLFLAVLFGKVGVVVFLAESKFLFYGFRFGFQFGVAGGFGFAHGDYFFRKFVVFRFRVGKFGFKSLFVVGFQPFLFKAKRNVAKFFVCFKQFVALDEILAVVPAVLRAIIVVDYFELRVERVLF